MARQTTIARTTYVTGYWRLPQNAKRSPAHYESHLSGLFRMISGGNLVLLHNDDGFFQRCSQLAHDANVKLLDRRFELSQLPCASISGQLLESCKKMEATPLLAEPRFKKDKGVKHFFREYKASGAETYKAIMTIWMSKIPVVTEVAASNPFGSSLFGWVNISVSRFRFLRKHFDFTRAQIDEGRINHYGTESTYRGKRLRLNASFLCGKTPVWNELNTEFQDTLNHHLTDAYAHDEETILSYVLDLRPDLFNCIGDMHTGLPKRIGRVLNRLMY